MQQQRQIVLIRAGVMLEQAFALIYRSSFAAGNKVGLSHTLLGSD
jgi:hypothetical protein